MSRKTAAGRRTWGAAKTLLWMGGAFAIGAIPSGRIVAKAVSGESLDDLGDGKPGSSNVARSLGWKPGALVLAMDAGKAYVPAAASRLAGAGEGTVAAIGIATMLGHIAFVKGRGAACGLGAAYAMDPKMMTIDLVPSSGAPRCITTPRASASPRSPSRSPASRCTGMSRRAHSGRWR